MKTRTEKQMINLIISFAEKDKRIRAVLMNGSRVNPNAKKDIFQDYDIIYLVTDIKPFKNEQYVLSFFPDNIIVQKTEDKIYPPPLGDGRYNYNMQFIDGNRIDLSFFHLNRLGYVLKDSLTKVLLDKNKIIPGLPDPNEKNYFIKKPTRQLFTDCCDQFLFGICSHIPKTIWRKELPLLKFYIEEVLRKPLIMLLGWRIGIETGFDKSLGKSGKYLEKHLDPKTWNKFKQTYTDSNYDNIWISLFILYDLFEDTAKFVSRKYGFKYLEKESKKILQFLKHIRNLPRNTKSIY